MPPKSKVPYSVLGVVPEKQMLAKEMATSFPAQYSGHNICTTTSIDGTATIPAGEPLALPLTAPSGLSRIQFLVASQALGVPFFPNYCKEQGGLVGAWARGCCCAMFHASCINVPHCQCVYLFTSTVQVYTGMHIFS